MKEMFRSERPKAEPEHPDSTQRAIELSAKLDSLGKAIYDAAILHTLQPGIINSISEKRRLLVKNGKFDVDDQTASTIETFIAEMKSTITDLLRRKKIEDSFHKDAERPSDATLH